MTNIKAKNKTNGEYWTHNVAYHKWILKQISKGDRVLDIGCGDGLLVEKLSHKCALAVGIEPHEQSAKAAVDRTMGIKNVRIFNVDFEGYTEKVLYDAVIFVASIHHMDMEKSLIKAKEMLAEDGSIIIVGCAKAHGAFDLLIEALRVIPAKIGSLLHGEKSAGNIGVPTITPKLSLKQIKSIVNKQLFGAKIIKGLYYRYLLVWKNDGMSKRRDNEKT